MILTSHRKRLLTAAILLGLFGGVLYLGGWYLFALALVLALLGLVEFYGLFWPGREKMFLKGLGLCMAVGLLVAAKLLPLAWVLGLVLAAFWVVNMVFLFRYSSAPDSTDYGRCLVLFSGLMYLPVTILFFLTFNTFEILLVLTATMVSDTGAYYAGSLLGKRKIWPSVSPKKTWMGSLGGMTACVAACVLLGLFLGEEILGLRLGNAETGQPGWPLPSLAIWALLGVMLNLAAQFGDFFESALKRSRDIKDSGGLLPGHGGLLDRIDAGLLVAPVYAGLRALYGVLAT